MQRSGPTGGPPPADDGEAAEVLSEAALADKAELARLWRAIEVELCAQESALPAAAALPK